MKNSHLDVSVLVVVHLLRTQKFTTRKQTKILTFEGHVSDQELAFRLLEYPVPNF